MRVAATLLFAFTCTAAVAQMSETLNVNIVEVPVNVVDSAGNPIRGLTAANFKLYDQGKARPITAFETIDLAAAPSQTNAPLNPAARRSFLLLFDVANSKPKAIARAQESARNFVATSVQPRDLVGVGSISVERGFRLLAGFTTDRDLVAAAIKNPAGFTAADPLQLASESNFVQLDTTGAEVAAMLLGSDDPESLSGPKAAQLARMAEQAKANADTMRQTQRANETFARRRIERQLDMLGELARTLRVVPGRKHVVLLSEGFDASMLAGRDARSVEDRKAEDDYVLHGDVARVDNDQRFGSSTSQSLLSNMAKYFRGSDVVLNAIDIQGVRVQHDVQTGTRVNSNAALGMLASPTGGLVFENANSLDESFARMLRAQEVIYILAFQATTTKPGAFHPLEVKVTGVKGVAHISARAGYYENGSESAQERTLTIASVILNDVKQDGVHLNSFVVPFPTESGNAQVPVILDIYGGDVVRGARTTKTPVEIYVYAFDDKGVVRDRLYQRLTIDIERLREKLNDNGVKFYATLSLPPGSYAIKSLVRMPESEQRGFTRADVVVPERGAMALLPPVFIDAAARWVMIKGTSHAAAAPYPFHLDENIFVPAAAARIRSGETPRFAVFVQNANPDEITIETKPQAKMLGATRGEGTSVFVMELDDVAANVATLDITLHKKGVAQAQTVSVRVEP